MDVYHQFGIFTDRDQYPDCIPEEDNAPAFQGIIELQSATPTLPEGFAFWGPKLKPKRKKPEPANVRSGGGRRDRHSKVCTARGTRDRRVRLSPGTAIQFYDVQDRLGYDRPSMAIDWLMKEAKTAIDALYAPPPAGSHLDFAGDISQKLDVTPRVVDLRADADDIPGSGFTFFNNEAQFVPSVDCPENFFPSLSSESYNLEMGKMHRVLRIPTTSPAISGRSQLHYQREPLQSSVISGTSNLAGEELLTMDGMDSIQVTGKKLPEGSCPLHYHQL